MQTPKDTKHWKQGTKIHANGYDGVIVRQYSCRMWEVRLPGGVACLCDSDIEERLTLAEGA